MLALTPSVLSTRQVAELFGVGRHTLLAWVRAGRFPKPFKPGKRSCFWHASVIEEALLGREAPGVGGVDGGPRRRSPGQSEKESRRPLAGITGGSNRRL
jgi:excisionase family DNA binding protein